MSSGCGDVLSLDDLKIAKLHQLFEAEVITGKQGGVAGGADIDYATNQVTGQAQKTLPAVLRDAGFFPASFDFTTGGTLTTSDRNKVVYDPVSMAWYSWSGVLPKTIPAGTNPLLDASWKPQTDPKLREDLANVDGESLIGEVQSIGGLSAVTAVSGKKVKVKGWYAGSIIGGGVFYYDATIAKSKHDGGKYVSPTVPYTTAQAFVAGVGETDSSGSGVWVRTGVSSALLGEWYGMLTGTVASPMLIAMAKTAGVEGLGVEFPAGNFVLNATATFLMNGSSTGNVKYIKGAGSRGTLFTVDVAALNTYAIRVTGSIDTANETHDMVTITGFRMRGNGSRAGGNIYTGFGLMVENVLGFTTQDVRTENFERGATFQNTLYGLAIACRFQSSKCGALLRRSGLTTGVNAMTFLRCDFNDNAIYCVQATESHNLKFDNCTFEGNGGKLDNDGVTIITPVSCVQTDSTGGAGGVGAVFDTCYFEANTCVDLKFLVNTNRNQLNALRNCIFNKTRTDMVGPRIQMISSLTAMTAGLKATLQMDGNRFFSGTNNADALYPDVEVTGFTVLGYGHAEILDYNNVFTANTSIAKDTYVAHKKAPDDGFICRGLSAGGFTATASRNVLSCTRQSTGVYRIVTNQLTTAFTFAVQLDNAGFATISTAENNEAVTINVFDGAGAAADRNFRVIAKLL